MHYYDMADVCTCQTIQLLHLYCGIIAVIAHEVSPAQFFKMLLGIIGTTILTLCRYLIAIGVCPKCRLAHRKGCLHLISRHQFRDAVEVNGCFENLPFQWGDSGPNFLYSSSNGAFGCVRRLASTCWSSMRLAMAFTTTR